MNNSSRAIRALGDRAQILDRLLSPTVIRSTSAPQLEHALRLARDWAPGIAAARTDREWSSARSDERPAPVLHGRDFDSEGRALIAAAIDAIDALAAWVPAMLANVTDAGTDAARAATTRAEVAPCAPCWDAGIDTPSVKVCRSRGVSDVPMAWCRRCFDLGRRLGHVPSAEEIAAAGRGHAPS